ncbi:hypothetical protein CEK25_013593 [Fusarium fujikuroi]|nr:hypothetical protein CEK25_013593 [Fusarium fujikuroi]
MARTSIARFFPIQNLYCPLPDQVPDIDDEAWLEDFVEHGKSQDTLESRKSQTFGVRSLQRGSIYGMRVHTSSVSLIHHGMSCFLLLERPMIDPFFFLSWTTGRSLLDVSCTTDQLPFVQPSEPEQDGILPKWDEK